MPSKKVITTGLNPKQELFCQVYCGRDCFSNGVKAYIEAYGINTTKPGAYNSAKESASALLTNLDILSRIRGILDLSGLNNEFVDRELLFVMTQNADLNAKVQAMKEYNKLNQRIQDKLDITTNGKELPTPIYGGMSVKKDDES